MASYKEEIITCTIFFEEMIKKKKCVSCVESDTRVFNLKKFATWRKNYNFSSIVEAGSFI